MADTGDVIIVMITSKEKKDYNTIPILETDINFKLPRQSYVRCRRLATVDESIIFGKIGDASEGLIRNVRDTIERIISGDLIGYEEQ